jgi:hypothetical protein
MILVTNLLSFSFSALSLTHVPSDCRMRLVLGQRRFDCSKRYLLTTGSLNRQYLLSSYPSTPTASGTDLQPSDKNLLQILALEAAH